MNPEALEKRAEEIVWEAASLRPGVPGHAMRTSMLATELRNLLRMAQRPDKPEKEGAAL